VGSIPTHSRQFFLFFEHSNAIMGFIHDGIFLFIYDYKINSNSSLCELCGKIASFLF